MATLTYPQLKAMIGEVITTAKLSSDTFSVTKDNVAKLIDKIGKIFTIDSNFKQDKLARFDAEYLSYGKTIEEWQADLILPQDKNENGDNTLAPNPSTFRPNFYSYTTGKKRIKQTIRNNDLERAVHNAGQFGSLVATLVSRIDDSAVQYKYGLKREMLGKLIGLAKAEMEATSVYATSTAYEVNAIVKKNASSEERALVFKAIPATNTKGYDALVVEGYLVPLDLTQVIAKPVDADTGEGFIKAVKKDVEVANDISQGHSLNGNALGASATGLVLVLKQGILPVLDVETMAGAFHMDKLAIPAEIIVVPDFGTDTSGAYGVLMDARGMGLYTDYIATREQFNAEGDFINYIRHMEYTAHISRNTFLKVYIAE